MQSVVFPHSPKNIPSSQLPAMGRRKHRQESTCQDASVLTRPAPKWPVKSGQPITTAKWDFLEARSAGMSAGGSESIRQTPHLPLPVKKEVQKFWQNSPCDSWFTDEARGTVAFYQSLDEHRYKVHKRLLSTVGFERTCGLRVLEIGCGCGSEAERFARAGACYTAVDLTKAAVSITQTRFQLTGLKGNFIQGDAECLPFADESFDLVYSHGVLHHTPDTPRTIREIYRVLAPGGRAVIMLYYRNSFNYHVNMRVVRRLRAQLLKTELGIKLTRKIWHEPEEELRRHAELIKQDSRAYLDMQNMLNRNTDGPDNPLSQAFSRNSASALFWQFQNVATEVMFWNPNWLPGIGKLLPEWIENQLAARWGWHLWINAYKGTHEADVLQRSALAGVNMRLVLNPISVGPSQSAASHKVAQTLTLGGSCC
jgi:ubiquinone/menaquinone biosynthesis C-methylase UbiE